MKLLNMYIKQRKQGIFLFAACSLIFLTAFLLQNTTIDQQYEQIDRYYREYSDDYDDDYYDDYNNFLDEFGDDYDDYFSPGDGWYSTPDTSPDSGTII